MGFVEEGILAVVERPNEPKLDMLDHCHLHALRPRHADELRLLAEEKA